MISRNLGLLFYLLSASTASSSSVGLLGNNNGRLLKEGVQSQQQDEHEHHHPQRYRRRRMDHEEGPPFHFALVSGGSSFFEPVQSGWETACKRLSTNQMIERCDYIIPNETDFDYETHIDPCVFTVRQLIEAGEVDGISAACAYQAPELFRLANESGIVTAVFDQPPPPPQPQYDDETGQLIPDVFDGFPPNAFIGTDNYFLGRTMARLLRQLRPEGGTYGIIHRTSNAQQKERIQGFEQEIQKDNNSTTRRGRGGRRDNNNNNNKASWYRVGQDLEESWPGTGVLDRIEWLAALQPTAILFTYQTPMRKANYTQIIDSVRHLNITFIGTDGADYQLSYLNRRYVDGLVGQLPYDMGARSAQVLYDLAMKHHKQRQEEKQEENDNDNDTPQTSTSSTTPPPPLFFPTNLVAYNLIPLELPELTVDQNLLGNLVYIGYTCFGIVVLSSIACISWTCYNSKSMVVRAAQPFFLVMTATGVVIMAGALVPLSFDDSGTPNNTSDDNNSNNNNNSYNVGICMSIPWLAFIGFTVTFSALFSKTWRVNRLFYHNNHAHNHNHSTTTTASSTITTNTNAETRGRNNNNNNRNNNASSNSFFTRIVVTERDVLMPFCILLTCNIVVLICWTMIDPLTYERVFSDGTDLWNREIASYGSCRSNNVAIYLVPLALINFSVLALACWQAFQARHIKSEFAEATYIGLAVFSLSQATITGIPIVVIVKDIPEAFYLVATFLIFLVCMVVLALIFVPKVSMHQTYATMSTREQKSKMSMSVRNSTSNVMRGTNHHHTLGVSDSGGNNINIVNNETSTATLHRHDQYHGTSNPGDESGSFWMSDRGLVSSPPVSGDGSGGGSSTMTSMQLQQMRNNNNHEKKTDTSVVGVGGPLPSSLGEEELSSGTTMSALPSSGEESLETGILLPEPTTTRATTTTSTAPILMLSKQGEANREMVPPPPTNTDNPTTTKNTTRRTSFAKPISSLMMATTTNNSNNSSTGGGGGGDLYQDNNKKYNNSNSDSLVESTSSEVINC